MSHILTGKTPAKARQVRPGQAYGVEVKAGELVQITDVQGKQVADFVAFSLEDRAEYLSTAATRSMNESLMLRVGSRLYSNRRNAMFELLEDSVGRHDMLFAACDPRRYQALGDPGHVNCREALAEALVSYDVDYDRIPDPINWFMNVAIRQRGELEVREPLSERNDRAVLRAEMDLLVIVVNCPPRPRGRQLARTGRPGELLVRVYGEP